VRHNWITELPGRCFPRFQTSLRELLLDDNRLTVLPFQMHTLDVLESFSMEGNDIKNPPLNYDKEGFPTLRKYWKRIEASEKTGILELVNMSLLMFPPELALEPRYSHALRYLDLSGNRIPTLHPNIDNMTNLETLRMENNLITVLPGEVFKCTNLVELNLDNNMIDDLPAMVGECTRLTNLSLNNNRLSAVPEEMAMLTGLIKLGLGDNQFVLGTAWWLAALTCLQSLWLYNNKLIALPVAIGVLTNLDDLRVEGNPLKDPPAKIVANGLKAVREYMSYNVKYESDQSGLAPPRVKRKLPRLVTYVPELINTATFCKHTVSSTAPSDSRGTYPFSNALDGYKEARSFWMSAPGVDNVVVDVDLGTRIHLQRVELHWRSNFSPRHYTVEVSEEGRQWFLVHRSIVDPSKGEGDVVKKEEDHITVCHLSYGTDRRDVILLRDDSASTVNSALPSTGVQHLRVHMTKRWFNTYRINQLEAWGDVITGASYVSVDMKDKTIAFKDA
jgi:Leucine-rich repeat (LRR) protein